MAGLVSTQQPEQVLPNTLFSGSAPMISPHLLSPHSPVTLQGLATLNLCQFPEQPKTLSGLRVFALQDSAQASRSLRDLVLLGAGKGLVGNQLSWLVEGQGPNSIARGWGVGGGRPSHPHHSHSLDTLLSLLPAWLPIWVWMTPPPGSLPSFPPPHRVRKPPSLPRSQGPLLLSSRNTQDAEL